MSYKNQRNALSHFVLRASIIGGLALLAGCGSPPPQTVSTTSQETTTTPAAPTMSPTGTLQPGMPGTTTTTTTNSQSQPAQ